MVLDFWDFLMEGIGILTVCLALEPCLLALEPSLVLIEMNWKTPISINRSIGVLLYEYPFDLVGGSGVRV